MDNLNFISLIGMSLLWLGCHSYRKEFAPSKRQIFLFIGCRNPIMQQSNDSAISSKEIPGPEVIKLFSCSTQLSMNFFLLIDVKIPTTVGILTRMSGKNNILCLTEP